VPSFPDFMDNFNNLYNISYLEFSSIWMNGADTDYGTPQMQKEVFLVEWVLRLDCRIISVRGQILPFL